MMIVLLLSLIMLILLVFYWLDGYFPMFPKIKFIRFENFYSVNPDRWNLYSSSIGCCTGTTIVRLGFGFIDYYRYKLWRRNIIENKTKQENSEKTYKVIAAVKQDIAESEAKAKQMKEEFLNNVKYIHENVLHDDIMKLGCVSKVPRAGQLCKPDQARRQIYHA